MTYMSFAAAIDTTGGQRGARSCQGGGSVAAQSGKVLRSDVSAQQIMGIRCDLRLTWAGALPFEQGNPRDSG